MAITFFEKQKKQKSLIFILVIVIFAISAVFLYSSFKKDKSSVVKKTLTTEKIKIDFSILENPILQQLQPFEDILSLAEEASQKGEIGKIGRDNPFIPY